MEWTAHLSQTDMLQRRVRLYLVQRGSMSDLVLRNDGSLLTLPHGDATTPDPEPTLQIPTEAMAALYGALGHWLGAVESPAQLRKDYEAERKRVDLFIDSLLKGQ
jgi:hypothetical protein